MISSALFSTTFSKQRLQQISIFNINWPMISCNWFHIFPWWEWSTCHHNILTRYHTHIVSVGTMVHHPHNINANQTTSQLSLKIPPRHKQNVLINSTWAIQIEHSCWFLLAYKTCSLFRYLRKFVFPIFLFLIDWYQMRIYFHHWLAQYLERCHCVHYLLYWVPAVLVSIYYEWMWVKMVCRKVCSVSV